MKNVRMMGNDPRIENQSIASWVGKDVLHIMGEYPDNNTSHCGNFMGDSYSRTPQPDIEYTVCGKCLKAK